MKNIIEISQEGEQLISSIDINENTLYINNTLIPESQYIGSGTYTTTVEGHTINIIKVPNNTGNIQLVRLDEYSYSLKKADAKVLDHLSIDENGYLKISDMYFNTPSEAGYILDQYGNFIHSRDTSSDSWNIFSYDGTAKVRIPFEGNFTNVLGAGLECTDSLIDTKQSNNGISATRGSTYLNIRDTNGLIMSTVRNEANPNGAIKAQLQARNYNSSGTLVKTGVIGIIVAKDGTLSYEVTEPDKFRQAIGTSLNVTVRNLSQSGDVTQSGTSYKTIGAFSYTTKTGRFICIASVPIKTSRYTSHSAIMINGTPKGVVTTNSQSMIVTNPMTFETFNPNTAVTIGVGINAQDSGTTATIPAYNPPMITVFDLPI